MIEEVTPRIEGGYGHSWCIGCVTARAVGSR